MALKDDAIRMVGCGLSVLPIVHGTKKFKGQSWKEYQARLMDDAEIRTMFVEGDFLAVVCGKVSGNLELIDFDIPGKHELPEGKKGISPVWKPFLQFFKNHDQQDLFRRLLMIETKSGGRHLVYRCAEAVEGNQKLAEQLEDGKREVLIETRGEGGYFLTFPTPGYTIKQGSFEAIPIIEAREREFILTAARTLNEVYQEHPSGQSLNGAGAKPGDVFAAKTPWSDILEKHGWTHGGRSSGNRDAWVRPGKSKKDGISATTGNGPTDLLYVHSSNAAPFAPGTAYSKFAAYTLLEHKGDFYFAAQALKAAGFGGRPINAKVPDHFVNDDYAGIPQGKGLALRQFKAHDFENAVPTYLVKPYLQKGKCILLDADGGTGKSCLAAAWAAALTSGREPITDEPRDPVNVLYLHRGEDTDEEITTVFSGNDGEFARWFLFSDQSLQFNAQGLADLEQTIIENSIELVVVDALFYFLSTLMADTYNALPAMAVMERLNGIAERTGCTFWNIRHTKKGNPDTKASDLGMGSVQFRNSHRGQLMLRFHPDEQGIVVCTDEKGSLLNPKGRPFCFRREEVRVIYELDMQSPFQSKKQKSKTEDCEAWLRAQLEGGAWQSTAIVERGEDFGFKKSLIYESATALGVSRQGEPSIGKEGRSPVWWARPGYDWRDHEWPDPFA